jgi:hypothetical protein
MRYFIALLVIFALAAPAFAQTIPPPPAGSVEVLQPVMTESPLDQLRDLQAKYVALRAEKDKGAKMLLIAGAIAGGLKILLSVVNRVAGDKPKRWLALLALFLAVPIALLTHYAAGHGWVDSIIVAGGGPGAIVVHELMKLLGKKPATAVA